MDWVMIITAIIAAIQQCQQDRDDIEAGLNNPGLRERWSIRKIVRKEWGLRGRDLWAKVDEGMDELRDLDSDDIAQLMAAVAEK